MWGLAFGVVLSLGGFRRLRRRDGRRHQPHGGQHIRGLAPHVAGSVDNGAGQFFTPINSEGDLVYDNYNSYQVSTVLEPNYIAFANNATIAGGAGIGSSITSSTSIAVTFTNTTGSSITPTLESTILPGGFGFYAGDLSGNPTLSNGVVGDINLTPQSKTVNLLQLLAGYCARTRLERGNGELLVPDPARRNRLGQLHRDGISQSAGKLLHQSAPVPHPMRWRPAPTPSARH